VDWERISETRGWHRGLDGRSLGLDLRRRLSAPPDGVHLLLDPNSTTPQSYRDMRWKKSELPPCRLVWVGDLIESSAHGSPDFEALVTLIGPGAAAGEFTAVRLPSRVFPFANVARLLRERSDGEYAGPGPEVHFAANRWQIDLWFDRRELVITTVAERAPLAITTLAPYPRFAHTPSCVVVDRRARWVVVLPCWEIFRYYYAQARAPSDGLWLPPLGPPHATRRLKLFRRPRVLQRAASARCPPLNLAWSIRSEATCCDRPGRGGGLCQHGPGAASCVAAV
jgi:hypothetical protein